MIATDLDRRIIKVNKKYEQVFGFTEQESIGELTRMFYAYPEDYDNQGKIRFNKEAEYKDDSYVVEYRRKDGTLFLGETSGVPIFNEENEKIGFIGVVRDISQRRQFDETVFQFHEMTNSSDLDIDEKIDKALQLACNYMQMDIGILSIIEGDRYTVRNSYSREGQPEPGQIFDLGKTYCATTYQQDGITAFHDVPNSEIATHPCYKEFQLNSYIGLTIKVNGKKYGTLNISSRNSREHPFKKREKDALIVTANWISSALSQAEHEENLRAEKFRAEETNKSKTNFIANISHEVRTPLNGIMGYADILANMIDDPDIRKLSQKIQSSATSLLDILNDVIDISKMEHGEFKIVRSTYNPKEVVQDAADLFMARADEKNNNLLVKIDPSMPAEVVGDSTRIRQVLNNILSNAVKFTKDGQIKISALYDHNKQNIRIQIADTGIGISEEMRDKVFEDYIQGDVGITKHYGGTGLGLSISKKLVEMMNGTIKLDSKLGLGTSLTLSIPAQIVEKEAQAPKAKKEKRGGKYKYRSPIRVSLVEDIVMNIEIATAMLQRENCIIDVANNGKEALEKLGNDHYDIIFLDIQMPDIDGITVAKQTRKMGVETPIIALTAHVMRHETEEFRRAGMDDYLPKPLVYKELQKTLSNWV